MHVPDRLFAFRILALAGLLVLLPSLLCPVAYAHNQPEYYRGRVIKVEDTTEEGGAILHQQAEVRLVSGPYEGKIVVLNHLYVEDDYHLSLYLRRGMELILAVHGENGTIHRAHLYDVARDRGLYYLGGMLILLLLLIGKKQGVKTIVTLAFTGGIIAKVVLPLLLRGFDPIPVATVSATVIIVFTLLVIGGLNAKSFSAIAGTVFGVALAGALALWVGDFSHLTGFSSEDAQMLIFGGHALNIRGLLFAGIIIGSLGAVTDVGMSVASAAWEIRQASRRISPYALTRTAMNVGRDIMGTMANTLVLAYVGSALPLLLLFMTYDMNWLQVINSDLIATELVRGLAGSIGLIASIPITAAISGILMSRR